MNQICEYSEAGITVRGTYYPPNKEPKEGDRKLYLGIEATNELAIQKAKTEIIRLIKEELQRLVRYLKYHSLTPTVAIWVQLAIKHPVPDRVKPSFVIFDIWTLWRSALSVRVPGCQNLQVTTQPDLAQDAL